MTEWTIPPCQLPDEPYTAAQYQCYVNACQDYLNGAQACIAAGGSKSEVQACINSKHAAYLKQLPICDLR